LWSFYNFWHSVFTAIARYVHEEVTTEMAIQLINIIADRVALNPNMVDEVLCQVCKQTYGNPNQ